MVADAACFLLSGLARAITGTVLRLDGRFHAMATCLNHRRSDVWTPLRASGGGDLAMPGRRKPGYELE